MQSLFFITAVLLGMLFVPAIESRKGRKATEVTPACAAARAVAQSVCGQGTSGGSRAEGGGGKRTSAATRAAAAAASSSGGRR